MEGEQQAVYEQYPQFKEISGVSFFYSYLNAPFQLQVKTPIEMREDIVNEIAEFVTSNSQLNKMSTSYCRLLRTMLDKKHGPCWHVFVGKNFGAYAIHDKNMFLNFKYMGYTYLVYKTTV